MTKPEAEKAIRHLAHKWREARGLPIDPSIHYSFSDFRSWLEDNHYSHYLRFRSVAGPLEDAERWFDQEMKQTWRN